MIVLELQVIPGELSPINNLVLLREGAATFPGQRGLQPEQGWDVVGPVLPSSHGS